MHHKWQKVFEAYQAERKQVMEFDPGDKNFMKADGSLKSPYDKKFPLYSRFNPILENSSKLREDDGVSGYSKEWWADSQVSIEQQYHETLAEIARSDFETDGEIFKPGKSVKFTHNFHWYQRVEGPWADLYHAVNETYEELKGRK